VIRSTRRRHGILRIVRLFPAPGLAIVTDGDLLDLASFARSRKLVDVTSLVLKSKDAFAIPDDQAEALKRSPYLSNLESLTIEDADISALGLATLLGPENFPALVELEIQSVEIGDGGAQVLAASSVCSRLRCLRLQATDVGDRGLSALVAAGLTALVELSLHYNRIGDEGVSALADHIANVHSLWLSSNRITGAGARRLRTGKLEKLDLGENPIPASVRDELRRQFAAVKDLRI
jgi:hypothetical protein